MRFKKGLAVLTASVMTLSALSGCSNKVSKDKFSTTVGATYGDQKIYLEEFQFYTKLYQPQFDQSEIPMLQYWYGLLPQNMSLEQLYSEKVEMSNGHYMTPTQMLKEYVVKVVYQTRVLNDYAKENGITLSDDDQKKIDEKVKEYTEGDSKYLLEGTTVSEETIKRILTEKAMIRPWTALCSAWLKHTISRCIRTRMIRPTRRAVQRQSIRTLRASLKKRERRSRV